MAQAAKPAPAGKSPRKRSSGPAPLTRFNPARGEVIGEIQSTDPREVANVVAQTRKVAPEWAAIAPEGRARIMREVRYRIYDRLDEIVETVATECGKPRLEALTHDAMPTALQLLYFERVAAKVLAPERAGRLLGPLVGSSSRIEWRPFGVVGAITPWNYPVMNCFLAFSSALFAGNTVVIKPSEVTPGVGELIRDLLEPLPPGVATVIQGGGDVGGALVDAPCDKISFIGSPATGRRICEAAAKHLTPVVMELGGRDASVVCADADLDYASSGVLWGSFYNAGQTCCSIERTYVVDSVADEFTDKLLTKLAQVRQVEGGELGPLTFGRQFEIVERHVNDAVAKGARLLAGGPDAGRTNENGSLWYAPTVIEGVTEEMDVIKEETFGPVVSLIRVRDEDEAVRRANEEGVNLTASVWTRNPKRAERIASQLRAGTVTVNDHGDTAGAPWTPWGGVGESGFGRLNGKLGLREFVVPVHVATNTSTRMKKLWWYPYDEATTATFRAATRVLTSSSLAGKAKEIPGLVQNAVASLKKKL